MPRWKRRVAWIAITVAVALAGAAIVGGFYLRRQLDASFPIHSGTLTLAGLDAIVTIERDALGVPTIAAGSRRDAAQALGFLHAQDRFFQMDLQRRQAAGELSALVGPRALEADRAARLHRFRRISQRAIDLASPEYRAVLDAYTRGVNAGLATLGAPPIEYLVLRAPAERWLLEDSILTILAMFQTLQGRQGLFEATFGTLADTVPAPLYDYLTARGSDWDAPMIGGRFERPSIPGANSIDLRRTPRRARPAAAPSTSATDRARSARARWPFDSITATWTPEEAAALGSNNWAVAGSHTATGAALVANDMHLAIGVPNIWYRASMILPDPGGAPGATLHLTGVTLPGLPSLVVGSNGHVAWGFTNTGGDWSDLVVVDPDRRDPSLYLTPWGPKPFDEADERIDVAGRGPVHIQSRWTVWGPVIRRDHRGRELAQRWVAHDAEILARDITAPERVRTVDEALAVAAGLGIPAQNFVVGDSAGRIGWTIAGPIPRRAGFDGSRPTSWADGSRRWEGYLPPEAFPRIVDPSSGRLWTANAPAIGGEPLAAIGEGGYADGIRARLIRDRLLALDRATPADMLALQLDDTALFHERWRGLLLETLTLDALKRHPARAEFRRLVESTWTGRAEPASVAYRLVRTFRANVSRIVFDALTEPASRAEPDFDFGRALRSEGPLWPLVTERPAHLLDPAYASWDALLVEAVDAAIADLLASGGQLADRTWGTYNRAIIRHPLGSSLPFIGRWVNMPDDPLPGDLYTPRAHTPRAGPSQRMAVSPGREAEGVLHMPTGQSGHPLSPHYRDQHRAWVAGEPVPLLPGPAVSRLTLTPGGAQE